MTRYPKYIRKPDMPKFSPESKAYHVVSSFLAQRADKLNLARLACQLKNTGNHALANKALKSLFGIAPVTKTVVWGNLFPKKQIELGNGDNCFFFKPESLEREISWTIFGLKPFTIQLTEFIKLRDDIERLILLGNYSIASDLLEQCKSKLGYSVWYYEMRLTIDGAQQNIENAISLLSDVNEIYQDGKALGIVPILLQNLYNRSFSNTPLRYDNLVRSTFKRNRDFSNRLDYYLFRLNYYQYTDLSNLSEIVEMEHIQSAIDRYNILLYVLRTCFVNQKDKRATVLKYAKQLYEISSDPRLFPFMALVDSYRLPDSYFDELFISILDGYYTGQYKGTAERCRQYLNNDPSNLFVIKIYCRSLMFLGKGYQIITPSADSLLNQISFNTYKILVENDNLEHVERLSVILKRVYGLRIAAQLDRFVKNELREPHTDLLAYLSIQQYDPAFIRALEDEASQLHYLEFGLKHLPSSVVIRYRKECVERTIRHDSPVVAYIRNVDTARITFERGDYKDALEQWLSVFSANNHSLPTAQTAVDYIFRSYQALGIEYRQEAVNFYVKCFMENRSFVSKVDTVQFMTDLKQSRYNGTRIGLDLMLFVFLNADKYPQKQFVLERYCKYEHVIYPSELMPKFKERDLDKVELFYSILLNDDILFHHYKLKSTLDVLDEKLKIVNYLKEHYPNKHIYSDLYTELMHEMVAYRGMNKLDDNKIYVNEDAVMKYELCDIESMFERFHKQAALARKDQTVLLVGDINFDDPSGISEMLQDTVSYSKDAMADIAGEVFDYIRHAFLKSRFGLGTYLSTRIRHGVFEGELRSFLERLNLILSTDHGSYVTDTYWHQQYHVDVATSELLNNALSSFSRETDNLITSFKDSVIQIRINDDDPNKGAFCYNQTKEEVSSQLLLIEASSSDAQDFCKKVMEWLWEITEHCLEVIRGKVQDDLRPLFTNNIDTLEHCVEQINSHDTLRADLLTAINKAREDLNTRIVKIEKWFFRQEAKLEDFLLSDHIKMALETTKKYSPDVNVAFDISLPNNEPMFKAQYSASMFDLLLIFLSNIFKYSYEEYSRPVLFQVSVEENSKMHMHIENKLRSRINEEEQNLVFQRLVNEEAMIQKESGSGLAKAMNIIKYDFGSPENTYTIVASNGKCVTDVYIRLTNMIK